MKRLVYFYGERSDWQATTAKCQKYNDKLDKSNVRYKVRKDVPRSKTLVADDWITSTAK